MSRGLGDVYKRQVYMPFILSAGGGYLNESMDGLGLNDEKSAQILQNFADLINVYHVSPTAVDFL